MAKKTSQCPHVINVGGNTWEDVEHKKLDQGTCMTCDVNGPNLWLCIQSKCLYVGCGEKVSDHSASHSDTQSHFLTLNMTTMRIWCYKCECEVYKDGNNPPLIMRDRSLVLASPNHDSIQPTIPCIFEESDSDDEDDDVTKRPRGLTGLQNIGNTCYMNAALQSLSNCPPLTRFFRDCPGLINSERKPNLSRSFLKLMQEMWHKKRPSYVVPTTVVHGIKMVHPMFRGYTQQDTQEFLRCFMDQLHEELKTPSNNEAVMNTTDAAETDESSRSSESSQEDISSNCRDNSSIGDQMQGTHEISLESTSQSDTDYETCDSGMSSERSSVEHNLSSLEEVNITENRITSNSKSVSAPDINQRMPPANKMVGRKGKKDKNRIIPDDSGVSNSSSLSNIAIQSQPDGPLVGKDIKETVNLAHRQASGDAAILESQGHVNTSEQKTAPPETGDNCGQGEIEPAVIEVTDTITDVDSPSPRPKIVAGNRSRNSSETDRISSSPKVSVPQHTPVKRGKKKKSTEYTSIISDIFDGKILSSVQCNTCERVSSTRETFQDLSLPIPTKDHLHAIHASQSGSSHKGTCGDVTPNQGWIHYFFGWMKSWLWGPAITLQDCLAAFFSSDELKGDNMYSCEKCKKLRNGVKYAEVMQLPEILCVHLKRFRHEFMFSSKISSYVSFPSETLDMTPYIHKECKDQVRQYDLIAVICHHGTAGGGHYTAYGLNSLSERWYEFDDQYVTEVDISQVENSEAYVLFYRKRNDHMHTIRQKANEILETPQNPSLMKFFISRPWLNKFNTFAEPGPITNYDIFCKHGGVSPTKWEFVGDLALEIPQQLWQYLHGKYGGGPTVNHLYCCKTCQMESEELERRQKYEIETFVKLHDDFQNEENPSIIYAISLSWFKEWENFVRRRTDDSPGPIENNKIAVNKGGQIMVKQNSDHGQLSKEMWQFLFDIYGGGPELILKQNVTLAAQAGEEPVESEFTGSKAQEAKSERL